MKYIFLPSILIGIAIITFSFTNPNHKKPTVLPIKKSEILKIVGYGERQHPIYKVKKLHTGIDYIAKHGTPVMATADGKVTKLIRQEKGYGNQITVTHSNHLKTTYSHLSTIDVKLGQKVIQFETIAKVGNSGTSTGPHLHYEIEVNDEKVDPASYIQK